MSRPRIEVAVPTSERYVDARRLAELMGISERTIKRWVREGIPSETWGMGRTRRFLPSRAIAWARDRDQSRMGASTPPGPRANAPGSNHQEVP